MYIGSQGYMPDSIDMYLSLLVAPHIRTTLGTGTALWDKALLGHADQGTSSIFGNIHSRPTLPPYLQPHTRSLSFCHNLPLILQPHPAHMASLAGCPAHHSLAAPHTGRAMALTGHIIYPPSMHTGRAMALTGLEQPWSALEPVQRVLWGCPGTHIDWQ